MQSDAGAYLGELCERTAYSEPSSELHSGLTKKMAEWALSRIDIPEWSRVLDIGSGSGVALEWFTNAGYNPVGINILEEDTRVCCRDGYECYMEDMHNIVSGNLELSGFYLAWCRHALEHSPFPMFALKNIYDALLKGGYLYVEVPAPETPCHHERNPNHFSVFTYETWAALLDRAGFEVIDKTVIKFRTLAGEDEYYAYICKKKETIPCR